MRRLLICTVLLLSFVVLSGCEENLASREHFDIPFTIYGVLSPDLATQSIRVYPLEDFPTLGSPEPLDVDVFSTSLGTGERVIWRDTVVVDPNGQHEFIFWAPFRAEFGDAYRVEVVRRADGAGSYAEVRIPEPVTVSVVDDEDASSMQVLIEGDDIRALKPVAVYSVDHPGCDLIRNQFSYQGLQQRVATGWQVELNMVVDQKKILFNCSGITIFPSGLCPQLVLRALDLHVLIGDDVWDPPGGTFDPTILSQPNAMTNVENGFGFIGAGYRVIAPLSPSTEAVEYACFADAL